MNGLGSNALQDMDSGQRQVMAAELTGPVLVTGVTGTGKTHVALHRAVRLLEQNSRNTVLFCVPRRDLVAPAESLFAELAAGRPGFGARMTVTTLRDEAEELHGYVGGRAPVMAPPDLVRDVIVSAFLDRGGLPHSADRLLAEWHEVIDPLRITTARAYAAAPHVHGWPPLADGERVALWPAFDHARHVFDARMQLTDGALMERMASYFAEAEDKPYTHLVLDDAGVLDAASLRFAATLLPRGAPGLLVLATDDGHPAIDDILSAGLGLPGFSRHLRLRQSRIAPDEIVRLALSFLPGEMRPQVVAASAGGEAALAFPDDEAGERAMIDGFVADCLSEGIAPEAIAVVDLSRERVGRSAPVAQKGVIRGGPAIVAGSDFDAILVTGAPRVLLETATRGLPQPDGYSHLPPLAARQVLSVGLAARKRLLVLAQTP